MASRSQYVAVVAIDFGTTYSGFAYSFTTAESGIHMNKDWRNKNGSRSTPKTPTTILLRPNKEFDSFGYDADDKYVQLSHGEQKNYYYFKHFKMELHTTKSFDRTTQLTAANGRKVDAMVVFSLSLKYMKDKAFEKIKETMKREGYNFTDTRIQWVLTVPAIWTPAAKQFMREAAYQAGITSSKTPNQLIIALEPEGAAIFCRKRKLCGFIGEEGNVSVSDAFYQGSRYLVMDIGGGTLDVTAHEILADGTIKEIYQVTGGAYGGIYVDQKFASLLESIFGIPAIKNYSTNHPADWLRLTNEFEMQKRERRALDDEVTRILLPRSFTKFVPEFSGSDLSGCLSRSCSVRDVEIYNDEFICLGPNAMKRLFQPVVSGIVCHMTGLFAKAALRNISHLFMVGGFAESDILQEAIKNAFSSRCRILIPSSASIAVVQGATMFGQKPSTVSSRLMATTYGFRMHTNFDPKVHSTAKKEMVEGVAKCKDFFKVVVKENDLVKLGEKRQFTVNPLYSYNKAATVTFFTSTDPNVKYTTDPTVGPSIGTMTVDSPDTSKGKDRDIEVSVYFGGTEIKATAIDKTSGNTAIVYLDFLCKS